MRNGKVRMTGLVKVVVVDKDGDITDVTIDYTETFADQNLRYSRDYATLPVVN